MARAKTNGIKIGRPKLGIAIRQKIAQRAAKGETPYAIAKAVRIDRHTANQSSPHIGIATGVVGPASPHLPDLKAPDMANRLGVA